MKLSEAIGQRLTQLLEGGGWSFYKVEKEGGIDRSTVAKIAKGQRETLEINTLYQILQTIGVELKDFFDDPIFANLID